MVNENKARHNEWLNKQNYTNAMQMLSGTPLECKASISYCHSCNHFCTKPTDVQLAEKISRQY